VHPTRSAAVVDMQTPKLGLCCPTVQVDGSDLRASCGDTRQVPITRAAAQRIQRPIVQSRVQIDLRVTYRLHGEATYPTGSALFLPHRHSSFGCSLRGRFLPPSPVRGGRRDVVRRSPHWTRLTPTDRGPLSSRIEMPGRDTHARRGNRHWLPLRLGRFRTLFDGRIDMIESRLDVPTSAARSFEDAADYRVAAAEAGDSRRGA
jgi:hypothetical protein